MSLADVIMSINAEAEPNNNLRELIERLQNMEPVKNPVKRPRPGAVPKTLPKRSRPKAVLKAKPNTEAKKAPKFLCPDHKKPMTFDKQMNAWYCTEGDCKKVRATESAGGPDSVTRLKGFPQVIAKYDTDGDVHWFLYYKDEEIMVELPYTATVGSVAKPINVAGETIFEVKLKLGNYTVLDKNGNQLPPSRL